MVEQHVYAVQVVGSIPAAPTMIDYTCPECRGSKGELKVNVIERPENGKPMEITSFVPCYYCAGTGFKEEDE